MIKPIIAANWKMNKTVGESIEFADRLKRMTAGIGDRQVVIAPPFTALYPVAAVLRGSSIGLAAQNVSENEDGAYTGEISALMLADAGCTHVIVGHSERRVLFGESDVVIGAKIALGLRYGLRPIVCVGETLAEREAAETFGVLEKQIKEALNQLKASDIERMIIAYEPVWAIGTGKTATPEQAGEAHAYIREQVLKRYGREPARRLPVIYGGSVNADNISRLMAQPDVNGALVGGASLNVDTFLKIIAF